MKLNLLSIALLSALTVPTFAETTVSGQENTNNGAKTLKTLPADTKKVLKDTTEETGKLIRGTAKDTGDVIKGAAKDTGDVIKGTAKDTKEMLTPKESGASKDDMSGTDSHD